MEKQISFEHSPTLWRFMTDDSKYRFIVGPVGSGTSTGCCTEIMRRALLQEPSPDDNTRYFKAMVVRNTMPELRSTTLQTWSTLFSEESCGQIVYNPLKHHIKIPTRKNYTGLDLLVEFIGLDKPKDVAKLLSWEGSIIWFNEFRSIPWKLIQNAIERVGRYPSMGSRGVECTWRGVIGDSNAMEDDHPYCQTEREKPDGWAFFRQPPAVLQVENKGAHWESVSEEPIRIIEQKQDYIFQSSRDTYWTVNPKAENLPNLPFDEVVNPDKDPRAKGAYYPELLSGKDKEHIKVYYQARNGLVADGKPVISEFNVNVHVLPDTPYIDDAPLLGGGDIGGGTLAPSFVLGQRHPFTGMWVIHDEVVCQDMGLHRFCEQIHATLAQRYDGKSLTESWGDPAGFKRDELFETSAFDHMRQRNIPISPAPTNDVKMRVQAIKAPFGRMMPDSRPGIIINARCKQLIKALAGKWCYRRLQVSGEERYSDVPCKDHPYSDVADALGYLLCGGGEARDMRTPHAHEVGAGYVPGNNPSVVDFNVFGD
jgi:hypothetical protein